MVIYSVFIVLVFFSILVITSLPLGKYMAKVFNGEKTFMSPVIRPIERFIYKICCVNESEEMTWKTYALAFILFNIIGIIVLMAIQMLQGIMPLNPQKFPGVRWDLALNTSISFVANTNWQSYGGESTMSYLTQALGLSVHNFVSAGIGMATGVALIRGFIRKETDKIGNMWVDMTRAILYILLPLSMIFCVILISQGVVQNFKPYVTAETVEGGKQIIPMGPVASQIVIKQLGTNGGGFFNANSAHPFENSTFISNLIECFLIIWIPMGFVFMFGYMIKKTKQGKALFLVMTVLYLIGLGMMLCSEYMANPNYVKMGLESKNDLNMEGKENRFGVLWSVIWSQSTTATSNGSVNSMHDSYMPLSGMIQMFNIGIGEAIFGGVGVGFKSMIFYVVLTMFIAGLMIGRTPEFMGKKFGPFEMAMSVISLMMPLIAIVTLSAIAVVTKAGLASLNNPGPHGLSEILYAYTSTIGNNGSAFAGLSSNSVFYNTTLSLAMLIGRFATIIPGLSIAGSLAAKKNIPENSATFPTTGVLFIVLVVSVVLIVGALTFFPIYSLGPILEHLILIGK